MDALTIQGIFIIVGVGALLAMPLIVAIGLTQLSAQQAMILNMGKASEFARSFDAALSPPSDKGGV